MSKQVDVVELFKTVAARVEKGKTFSTLTADMEIGSVGIDSVSMMEIIGEMEDELDITISDEKLAHLKTIGDIEKVIQEQLH